MAKAIKFFSLVSSFGRKSELAQSVHGTWFTREYGYNGFGNGFSKWAVTEAPTYTSTGISQITGETIAYDKPRINAGFGSATEHTDMPRVRLPETLPAVASVVPAVTSVDRLEAPREVTLASMIADTSLTAGVIAYSKAHGLDADKVMGALVAVMDIMPDAVKMVSATIHDLVQDDNIAELV